MSFLAKLEEDLKFARWANVNGRFKEGLEVTTNYVGPTSRSREFLHAHATLLQSVSRFEEADTYLARFLELEPNNLDAMTQRIDGLFYTGRKDEAIALTASARAAHPHNGTLFGKHLCSLLSEEGPEAAMAALKADRAAPEPCRNITTAVEVFRQKLLSLHDVDQVRSLDPEDALGLGEADTGGAYNMRAIYEQFESLGANCDFGFIQRMRRAEPLSLMRWTSVTPANLVRMLSDNLVGYDEASRYTLQGLHTKEYMLFENVYETVGHTGVNSSDIGHDEFLARLTRRQAFLTRKFLAELAAGKKIFIYKAKEPMSDEEIAAIDAELVRLGARKTMFTMPTSDPAKAGTISFPAPTRAVAYLTNRPFTESMHEWDKIIVAAYDHFTRAEAAAA